MPTAFRLGICPLKMLRRPNDRDCAQAAPEVLVVSCEKQPTSRVTKSVNCGSVPRCQGAGRVHSDQPNLIIGALSRRQKIHVTVGVVRDTVSRIDFVEGLAARIRER